jgi:elongation factor P
MACAKVLAYARNISMLRPDIAGRRAQYHRGTIVRVIASSLRKGNVVDLDGQLYVVLNAESFHPGKGTPTTQVDMRRISDGVKTAQRYKTTEQVERAFVEDREHQFLYQDGDGFHFMNTENYDQVTLQADLVGDAAAYLQPEMKVTLAVHEGNPVSLELPQKVILEVTETEPTVKGQTAASSYKPAVLSNGVRTMVPPFVGTGTKIVVMTADGSYVERAKD